MPFSNFENEAAFRFIQLTHKHIICVNYAGCLLTTEPAVIDAINPTTRIDI